MWGHVQIIEDMYYWGHNCCVRYLCSSHLHVEFLHGVQLCLCSIGSVRQTASDINDKLYLEKRHIRKICWKSHLSATRGLVWSLHRDYNGNLLNKYLWYFGLKPAIGSGFVLNFLVIHDLDVLLGAVQIPQQSLEPPLDLLLVLQGAAYHDGLEFLINGDSRRLSDARCEQGRKTLSGTIHII